MDTGMWVPGAYQREGWRLKEEAREWAWEKGLGCKAQSSPPPLAPLRASDLDLGTFADILVSLAGHVLVKVFLGEYWTVATSDFRNARARLWTLASLGYFGPPVGDPSLMLQKNGGSAPVELFWEQAEEQVERLLRQHSAEVEAVTKTLLDRDDMNGQECLEVMAPAAHGSNGNGNGNGHTEEDTLLGTQAVWSQPKSAEDTPS